MPLDGDAPGAASTSEPAQVNFLNTPKSSKRLHYRVAVVRPMGHWKLTGKGSSAISFGASLNAVQASLKSCFVGQWGPGMDHLESDEGRITRLPLADDYIDECGCLSFIVSTFCSRRVMGRSGKSRSSQKTWPAQAVCPRANDGEAGARSRR